MRVAVVAEQSGAGRLRHLADDGTPSGPAVAVDDLPATVRRLESGEDGGPPRWILPDCSTTYAALARCGVRVGRCHDVALTEALLLGAEGSWGAPSSLAAAWARSLGAPVPGDRPDPGSGAAGAAAAQGSLFDAGDLTPGEELADGADPLDALVAVHAGQLRRVEAARADAPGFGLLVAAESAAGLAAVELGRAGLPWDAAVHDELLVRELGPRPSAAGVAAGARPARLQALAEQVAAALGDPRLNPDSPVELLKALRRAGLPVSTTRRSELRRHEHPVLEPLVRYKELARLYTAHGWAWRDQWVHDDGRFRPEYVPGGVVSGRWASRGGGALQIPKVVRSAVVAPPGRVLVVADAGQLEPRVLAAMSRDPGMVAATRDGDLYTSLARQALGDRDGATPQARAQMKVALLSAMYGGGTRSPALAALRRRFPAALTLLEEAATVGEDGGSVRSVLGRTAPAAAPAWLDGLDEQAAGGRRRARGRFTRNFVIQASAADWAAVLLAGLRSRLVGQAADCGDVDSLPRLVFFQHDEVVVEAPEHLAEAVIAAVAEAGADATRLVLGDTGVHVPLAAAAVRSYADKG